MSTNTTSLSDTLPSSVLKLDSSGTNWTTFLIRFQDAIKAKGFWGYYTGTKTCPIDIPILTTAADGTTISTAPDLANITAARQWDKDERSAKSLLTQKLPDSTLIQIRSKTTVHERWAAIVKEYTEKGAYAQTELRQKFLD
ncbi:hypothetical protein B0H34DRAFT_634292, partial [Crassisporium funariophilum]